MIRLLSMVSVSMPIFWLGLILQHVFFQRLGWLPVAGEYDAASKRRTRSRCRPTSPSSTPLISGNWAVFRSSLSHIVLPALTVAAYPAGAIAQMTRASLLETIVEDHVRMARALGFSERTIFGRLALRPALNPVIALMALIFAYSLANTFLVESIFDWPGLGSYAVDCDPVARRAGDPRRDAVRGARLRAREPARRHRAVARRSAGARRPHVSSAASSPGLRRLTLRGPLAVLVTGLRRDRLAAIGAAIVVLIVLMALLAQWIAPHPADAGTATDPVNSLLAPSWSHPFGTDQVGRDVLSRVIFGARTSLRIAIESLALAALIGIPLGVVAGYVGGWVDDVIMRITDVFLAFPALLLALALAAVITPSVGNAAIAIAVTWWPWYTRLIRAPGVRRRLDAATWRRRARSVSAAGGSCCATCCRTASRP